MLLFKRGMFYTKIVVGRKYMEEIQMNFSERLAKARKDLHKAMWQKISHNPIAALVKLLDRCNNVSGMAAGFSKEKLVEYIKETEQYIYPLLHKAKNEYPMYSNQIFLIKYHMTSVIEAIKHQY